MTTTATDVTTIETLAHDEAMRRQAQELDRTLALLRSLDDAAWTAPTDCPAWDIRAMYQLVLGACEAGASIRENLHQLRRARSYRNQTGGPLEAALSAVQVRERAGLSPGQPAHHHRPVLKPDPRTAPTSRAAGEMPRAALTSPEPVERTGHQGSTTAQPHLADSGSQEATGNDASMLGTHRTVQTGLWHLSGAGAHRLDSAHVSQARPELPVGR